MFGNSINTLVKTECYYLDALKTCFFVHTLNRRLIGVICRFQHYSSYIEATVHIFLIPDQAKKHSAKKCALPKALRRSPTLNQKATADYL